MENREGNPLLIKNQFFEDHLKNISFFYTGKSNVIGADYADSVISNSRNAHYIRIATVEYDETLQSTEETIVNEQFKLRIENQVVSQYLCNDVLVQITGHIAGKRVSKNKFKCIVTPEIEYMTVPEIFITEEVESDQYRLGIWLNTQGVKRIYIKRIFGSDRNCVPMNEPYIDSRYYFNILKNEDLVYDVDSTNILSTITRVQFASGVNIYHTVDARLNALEAIKYPDIRFSIINTDASWVPEVEGDAAIGYQKMPLSNVDAGTAMSTSFVSLQAGAVKGFTVSEDGLYLLQIVSGLNTMSAIEDNNIELSLFKNNDIIQGTTLKYKLKADDGVHFTNPVGIGGAFTLVNLLATDIVRIQFKFLTTGYSGIVNESTKIQIMKLMQIP